ncbi:MAG: carotenoid biosynthesis protein [Anaerolineales bacterium]|nr:carotenoid biosynthesis protein [Anaerolineales bacterium]
MPNAYFIAFELIIYLQLLICLPHALKHGPANLLKLASGICFGVLLELATIRQLHAYEYGQFMIMVFDVPLCIGVAWGCIIYSVMEFSDASSLPYWLRPILDGLLALNIDLAMDAVAIRLGFWDWGMPLNEQYFGVPYGNFWAWFWVIFSFSLGYRLLVRHKNWVGVWLSSLLALVIGLIGVLATNAFLTDVVPKAVRPGVVFGTLLLALGIILIKKPSFHQKPIHPLAFWIPFLTHAYILIAGMISGVIFDPSFLFAVGLLMLVLALFLHYPTAREILRLPSRAGR